MPYEIPIVNRDGEAVCKVVWDGELYEGEFSILALPGGENDAINLAGAIERRTDLTDVLFHSEGDDASARGWITYEGTVCALNVVLPALGFMIGHIGGDIPGLGKPRIGEIEANQVLGGIE